MVKIRKRYHRKKCYRRLAPDKITKDNIEDITTFVFDDFKMFSPDLAWLENGKIELSDFNQGLVSFVNGSYFRVYYNTQKNIGEFQYGLI